MQLSDHFFSYMQAREFDGWTLHAMMEFVYRYLPVWGHSRWCRCSHCEQKHQAVKGLWQNTNSRDRSFQVLTALNRKSALIHMLSGGYWFEQRDDRLVCVSLGPDALARANDSTSVTGRMLTSLLSDTQPMRLVKDAELLVIIIFNLSARL